MIKRILYLCLCLYYCLNLSAQDQQYIKGKLLPNGTENSLEILDMSLICWADLEGDVYRMNQLEENQDGAMTFEINEPLTNTDNFSVLLRTDILSFGFIFIGNQVIIPGSANRSFEQGVYELRRCNGILSVYINDVFIHEYTNVITSEMFSEIRTVSVQDVDFKWTFPILDNPCADPPTTDLNKIYQNYTSVRKKLDSKYVLLGANDMLRIKFDEVYAISNDNTTYSYKVFQSDRVIKQEGTPDKVYGTNWVELDLTPAALGSGFYVLELTEINKDEKYYLRFKKE